MEQSIRRREIADHHLTDLSDYIKLAVAVQAGEITAFYVTLVSCVLYEN